MTPILHRIARASAVAAALLTSACVTTSDPYPAAAVSGDIGRWVPVEPGRARVALAAPTAVEPLAAREFRTAQGELVQTLTLPNNTAVPGDNELVAAFDHGPASIFQADIHAAKVGRYAMEPASLNHLIGEMLRAPFFRVNRRSARTAMGSTATSRRTIRGRRNASWPGRCSTAPI
ncbi:hypothetical protein [Skermanella pratensis]|uniref:hypothetical protein n=1 Tax=Skermanella pratensis TaxID=2233999 RepID=UPI0013018C54|nr:hypothetical protein [Skermanella pratensis]